MNAPRSYDTPTQDSLLINEPVFTEAPVHGQSSALKPGQNLSGLLIHDTKSCNLCRLCRCSGFNMQSAALFLRHIVKLHQYFKQILLCFKHSEFQDISEAIAEEF